MAIVRERELGTLEQLNVTPIARWELIVGKMLPYALIGFIDILLVVFVAVFWFEVPLRGSFVLLLTMCAVYLLTTLGLGLFVSTISSTQQQAMMTSSFFFLIPMVFLSGFVFPIEKHAGGRAAGDVSDSVALFPDHPARHLPQGCRPRDVLAGRARVAWLGCRHPHARHTAIQQAGGLASRW